MKGFPVEPLNDFGLFSGALLGFAPVPLPAPDKGLVGFNLTLEARCNGGPSLPYAVKHESGCLLGYPYFPMQLHAGDAFHLGCLKLDGECPFPQGNLGRFESRSGLNGEVALAIRASVGRLRMSGFISSDATATRAVSSVRPDLGFKPLPGGLFVRKHIRKLPQCNAFSEMLSRCFLCHNMSFHSKVLGLEGGYFSTCLPVY